MLAAIGEQFRPAVAVMFRRGPRAAVAGGEDARRFAAWTGLPYRATPDTTSVTVTLAAPPGPRTASRLASGIDRVAGTRM